MLFLKQEIQKQIRSNPQLWEFSEEKAGFNGQTKRKFCVVSAFCCSFSVSRFLNADLRSRATFLFSRIELTNGHLDSLLRTYINKMASEAQILKQVEFYFSDSNYPRDKFLRGCAAKNEKGCIFF